MTTDRIHRGRAVGLLAGLLLLPLCSSGDSATEVASAPEARDVPGKPLQVSCSVEPARLHPGDSSTVQVVVRSDDGVVAGADVRVEVPAGGMFDISREKAATSRTDDKGELTLVWTTPPVIKMLPMGFGIRSTATKEGFEDAETMCELAVYPAPEPEAGG